jgi:hypothetical protein
MSIDFNGDFIPSHRIKKKNESLALAELIIEMYDGYVITMSPLGIMVATESLPNNTILIPKTTIDYQGSNGTFIIYKHKLNDLIALSEV